MVFRSILMWNNEMHISVSFWTFYFKTTDVVSNHKSQFYLVHKCCSDQIQTLRLLFCSSFVLSSVNVSIYQCRYSVRLDICTSLRRRQCPRPLNHIPVDLLNHPENRRKDGVKTNENIHR